MLNSSKDLSLARSLRPFGVTLSERISRASRFLHLEMHS